MNIQTNFKTEKVIIEPLQIIHYDHLFTVASDPKIWEQHPVKDRCMPAGFQTFFKESLASKGALLIRDSKTLEVIGSSRFKILNDAERIIEIGWTFLSRTYWGGVYNYAIKGLMINHIIDNEGVAVLYVHKDNIRSQKAMRKLGAKNVNASEFAYCHEDPVKEDTFIVTERING